MQFVPLGRSGLRVPRVGLGCNNIGSRLDLAATRTLIDAALEMGVTLLDTADIYGNQGGSESLLGEVLAGRRDDVLIATKFGADMGPTYGQAYAGDRVSRGSRRYIRVAVEGSLRRLGTDYIDLYQMHQPDPSTPFAETVGALEELVVEGKVRYLGHSNFAGWQIAEAAHLSAPGSPFVSAQNQYSLLARGVEAEIIPACEHFGVGMLPFFPLANGLLTGKVVDGAVPAGSRLSEERFRSWVTRDRLEKVDALQGWAADHGRTLLEVAIGVLAAQPAVASVIAGATKPEQLRANAKAADWVPSADDLVEIDALVPSARP